MKKLSIISTDLLKAIQMVAPVVRDKNVVKIYDNILCEITADKLKVTAANQEVRASTQIEGVIASSDFAFCIEKNLIVNILSGLPLGTAIELEFGNNEIVISSKIGVYNLPIEPAQDYPIPKEINDANSFMVDAEFLLDGLKKASPFVDDATENINAIMIKSVEAELYIVGVDRFSFYEKKFPYNGDEVELFISANAARYITQSFDFDDPLVVRYNPTFFCVSCGDFTVEITQMQIKFPPYRKILDAIKKTNCFKIERDQFLASVKRFSTLSDKDNNVLVLDFNDNKVELYFENRAKGCKAKEVLDCVYNDAPFKIGFQINFLKSALNALEENTIEWYFYEPFKPTMFVEENTRVLATPCKFQTKAVQETAEEK
jgi:DNA polymerase III beta subunit